MTWDAAYKLVVPEAPSPPGGHPLVLALHGFGDDGDRLGQRLESLLATRFAVLLPDGPFPVEMPPAGDQPRRVGHAWYQYTGDTQRFLQALAFASDHLDRLLEAVLAAHPLDARRVAVLGYSQGGYLASVYALRRHAHLRGLVAVACRIKTEVLESELAEARDFPVLVVHGRNDHSVPIEPQEASIAALWRHGLQVEMHLHEGGHGLRPELVGPIEAFLGRVLA